MKEEDLFKKIELLDREKSLIFAKTCFDRTKHFFKNFEDNNDLSEVDERLAGGRYLDYLESKLRILLENHNLKYSFFEVNLPLFELAVIDDEYFGSSVESFSAQLVAIIACDILEYKQTADKEKINNCVDSVLEIINQNRSDLFYKKYPKKNDNDLVVYLKKSFEEELTIQSELLDMILGDTKTSEIKQFCTSFLVYENSYFQ